MSLNRYLFRAFAANYESLFDSREQGDVSSTTEGEEMSSERPSGSAFSWVSCTMALTSTNATAGSQCYDSAAPCDVIFNSSYSHKNNFFYPTPAPWKPVTVDAAPSHRRETKPSCPVRLGLPVRLLIPASKY